MSTKLIINGRVRARGIGRELPTAAHPLDEVQLERQAAALGHEPIKRDAQTLIPALPKDKEEGTPWYDAQDRVTYKVLRALPVANGWGSMGFWMARWKVQADMVLHLARIGHVESATEPASTVKRYRCLDEKRTLAFIASEKAREKARAAVKAAPPANSTIRRR